MHVAFPARYASVCRACKPPASTTARLVDLKSQHAHIRVIKYHPCLLGVCVRDGCWWAAGGESVIVSASQLLFVAFCLHISSIEADRPSLCCCSFASGFQALSVALMLPGIASLRGIGWQNLPGYLVEGVLQGPHPAF